MQPIPQCDPRASYLAQREEIDAAVAQTLSTGRYILGPEVDSFEREFAAFTGTHGALGVANGTDALELSLRALGIGRGHAVATVSHTAVATVVAIRATGAEPLFVDVEPESGLISTGALADLLSCVRKRGGTQLKAIVPVHLYGRCANMAAIMELASSYELVVVEDCAQSHGATFEGRQAGSWSHCASFSFYPTKNLGAIGDGGALVTNDPSVLQRAKLLREYGWRERYVSEIEGGNSRLDELQAAILRVKLTRLNAANERRAWIADRYRSRISNRAITLPIDTGSDRHVYHQFAIRCPERDGLRAHLSSHGIGSLVHYPVPIHLQPAYNSPYYCPIPLVETERWAAQVLSLPMFPELSDENVDRVADAVNEWAPRS